MLPFMFGKRPTGTRDETNLEESLLDLQIRGALLAEYGSARPPAGIFHRVLRKIQAREGSNEAGGRALILTSIVGVMQALYAQIRGGATGSAATRLMPAALALILLVVVADVKFQHLTGSNPTLQFSSHRNQATPMQDSTTVSLTGDSVDPGWYEPDPDIRQGPRARGTDYKPGTHQGNQDSRPAANGAQGTPAPGNHPGEQMYLTSGPY
ncbi:MAG: hypothetical protein M3437_13545 [Chloroflexota bacterium]|nr:hypothetical protein [Chloroflexota bacterium]MDQ5866148.1 hypothetical protein [Chloroflexota bacterium]